MADDLRPCVSMRARVQGAGGMEGCVDGNFFHQQRGGSWWHIVSGKNAVNGTNNVEFTHKTNVQVRL